MKNKTIQYFLSFLIVTALLAAPISAFAKPVSPFKGTWLTIDIHDGAFARLTIAGQPNGPFQMTITEGIIRYCNGEPGIHHGIGLLSEEDPFVLNADLRLVCFTIDKEPLVYQLTWVYDPETDTLSCPAGPPVEGSPLIWDRVGTGSY
jgi:hypothetical protein